MPPTTRKTAVAKKTAAPAAKKTAAPRTRKWAEPKVEILSAPVKKTTPPKMVSADKVAEVYQKVATDNRWCDDGRTSVKAALKRIGVEIDEVSAIRHVHAFLQVSDISPELIVYNEFKEAAAKVVLQQVYQTLAEAFPHGIKVTVPIGTTGRTGSVTVTFDVKRRPMTTTLYGESAGYTL